MNILERKNLIGIAVSAAIGLGLAGNAQAASYAQAYDNISGWSIVGVSGGFTTTVYDSESHAELNGHATIIDDDSGATPPRNSYAALGQSPVPFGSIGAVGPNYGWSAAEIGVNGDTSEKIAEAYVMSGSGASGGGSVNTLDATFTVAAGDTATLIFEFDAEKYLEAWTDGTTGSFAEADNNFNITVTDATGAGVFDWSPDGNVGTGITGGTETADAFDLSRDLFASTGNPGPLTYSGAGFFSASTFVLTEGTYSIGVSNEVHAHVNDVPEPASMFLMGGGLMGLAYVRRRRATKA